MKKTEFVLIGLLLAVLVSFVGLAQFVKAEESLKYKVYLPFVAKNADLRPKIEFTYVPPVGAPNGDPLRGRVYNVEPSEAKVVLYIYLVWISATVCDITTNFVCVDIYSREWQSASYSCIGISGGCDQKSTNIETINPDGTFNGFLSNNAGWHKSIKRIRGYLIRNGYQPPYAPDEGLPPDPPTENVLAMTEFVREDIW